MGTDFPNIHWRDSINIENCAIHVCENEVGITVLSEDMGTQSMKVVAEIPFLKTFSFNFQIIA